MSKETAIYSVVDNLERLAAAREAVLREARSLKREILGLANGCSEAFARYGNTAGATLPIVPQEPPKAQEEELSTLERYLANLWHHRGTLEDILSQTIAAGETAHLFAELARRMPRQEAPAPFSSIKPTTVKATAAAPTWKKEGDIMCHMSRIPAAVPKPVQEGIRQLAQEILLEKEEARARTLFLELTVRLDEAQREADMAKMQQKEAAYLRGLLRGLSGQDVATVDAALAKIERGDAALDPALQRHAERTAEAATRRANQSYAASAIAQELERLGYEIEDGFEAVFIKGGEAILHRQGDEAYRTVLNVQPEKQWMHFHLAREGDSDQPVSQEQERRDAEAEQILCDEMKELRERLASHRIDSRLVRRVPAGEQRVVVTAGRATASRNSAATMRLPDDTKARG